MINASRGYLRGLGLSEVKKSIADTGALDLVKRLSPHASYHSISPLVGGVSSNTYALQGVDITGESLLWVIREHGLNYSGLPVEIEYALLGALRGAGIKVPQPLLCDTSPRVSDYPFLVMTFVEGDSAIPPGEQQAYITRMARQLWEIHQVCVDCLPGLPQRLDPLPEVFDYLPEHSKWQGLRRQLEALDIPCYAKTPALLHGDFWPHNLLWQQGEIASVLDWEDAAVGDPISDVAGASLELRYRFGVMGAQQFIDAYAELDRVDPFRLALWQIYVAAAAAFFMGDWGLDADHEAHMRRETQDTIYTAAKILSAGPLS